MTRREAPGRADVAWKRLEAKAEGVRLAISYVDDALRIQSGSVET